MTDYLEIINYLDEASRRLNEAMSSISHAKISLESKHVKEAIERIERANGLSLLAYESTDNALKGSVILKDNAERDDEILDHNLQEELAAGGTGLEAGYLSEHIFRCKIKTPSLSKQRYFNTVFRRTFTLELAKLVNDVVGKSEYGQRRFKRCVVIFVSHLRENDPKVTAYFDNDNIGIKAILDAILPQFVSDDNVYFCDNIYISQRDGEAFSEVFIVEEGFLGEWFSAYGHYDFCQNFDSSTEKKQVVENHD